MYLLIGMKVDTKKCKECLSDIKIGSINYLKIRGDGFKKDINVRGSEYGLVSRLYYMAIDDRYMVDTILDIMSDIHKFRVCKGFNVRVIVANITFNTTKQM